MPDRRWRAAPLLALLFSALAAAAAPDAETLDAAMPTHVNCNADLLCVHVYRSETVRLVLESRTDKPLSFQLFLSEGLEALNPPRIELDRPGRRDLARFVRPAHRWSFTYRTHYGHMAHEHRPEAPYRLPYAEGQAWPVAQSHMNLTTHHPGNRYALDFAMPSGTPVHAARTGRVVSVFEDSDASSLDGSATGNHIWIRHADGTIGKYLHLAHGGALVEEGEKVRAGAFIGRSGDTGFTSGAHLHFSVSTLGDSHLYRTFNVPFETRSGVTTLTSGRAYHHP